VTIQFNCPRCKALIAFPDKHAGKHAKCLTCGQRWIIPDTNNGPIQRLEDIPEEKGAPVPGFYQAALWRSWAIFLNPANVTGLVFVTAAVCFKFFVGHLDYSANVGPAFRIQAPVGWIVTLSAWGCLFWYYLETISLTAMDEDTLPDIDMDGFWGFLWNVVRSLFVFVFALIVAHLPLTLLQILSLAMHRDCLWCKQILAYLGLFIFPIVILTVGVNRSMDAFFRPDLMLKPIGKAPGSYIVVVVLFLTAWRLQMATTNYGDLQDRHSLVIFLHLLCHLGIQVLAIMAMRTMGLYYRHYTCYFAW
jgi:hypothetical protein